MSDNKPVVGSPVTLNTDVTYDANPLVDGSVTKITSRMSDTVVAVWDLTFGWFDYLDDKVRIHKSANLKKLRDKVNSKIENIPDESLQEPKVSIVGPAIQSTEFYFEEDFYRNMFANLISASFDKRKNSDIHPSFSSVIKELSSNDAKVFNLLCSQTVQTFAITKTFIGSHAETVDSKYISVLMIRGYIHDMDSHDFSLSLFNLSRLGLIGFDWASHYNKEAYEFFDDVPLIREFRQKYSMVSIEPQKGVLSLTTYGISFSRVCL